MEKFKSLIEALEALELLRGLLGEDSENYLESKEIREPLEEAAKKIARIYEKITNNSEDDSKGPLDGSSVN